MKFPQKKGQLTIFIILAIIIVFAIVLFFILRSNIRTEIPQTDNPSEFIRDCAKDAVEEILPKILAGAGQINPAFNLSYNGKDYNYLCYASDSYQGCYNLYPILEQEIEENIYLSTKEDIQKCFNLMRQEFEDKGYIFLDTSSTDYSIDLVSGSINIILQKEMTLSRDGSSQKFKNFNAKIYSSLYNLVQITRNIVNDESRYCTYDYTQYMLLYPNYEIIRVGFNTNKIYWITNRQTGEVFKFAIRTCPFPT